MKPNVSVVIPTYNRESLIGRAVQSVLAQSFRDFELLIVDDGSTDNTLEKLKDFCDDRIKIIETPHRGVSWARNVGLSRAKGEWMAFLDSDDEWLPHKLESQWDYMRAHPSIKIVHGEEIWIRRGVRVNPMKKHAKCGGWIFPKCLPLCPISPSTVMIHREVLEQVGVFDPQMIVCEDYDLWLRITPFFEVGFVEDPIIKKYGGHPDQLSTRYKAMDYFRVKAISKVLQLGIGRENKRTAAKMLGFKAGILLKGYQKYGRTAHRDEVMEMSRQSERWL
ncbi:MAG: glycosyltransferase [Bacteriovoracales bacterium]|nr:glycosyltransferase [Bacteriovoracales bacterium]